MKIATYRLAMLVFIVEVLAGPGWAQHPPELDSYVPEEPMGYVLYTYDGRADINLTIPDTAAGKVAGQEIAAALSVPACRLEHFTLGLGVGCQWNRFEFDGVAIDNMDLYALTLPIDLIYEGLPRWTFWGNVSPGLFSDLKHINADDYRTLLHGLVLYRLLPQLQLAAGASYDREFGDDKVYPIGGAIWNIGRQWELNALFPSPSLRYSPTRRCVLFANARPAGNKWNLHLADDASDGDFKLESWQIGLGAEVEACRHIWLHGSAGMDVDRSYEVQDAGWRIKSEAGETWFARAGIVVR